VRAGALRVRYGLDSGHLAEPLLLALAAAHPELDLRTAMGVDAENLDAVREGRADAAFAWALDGREGDLSRTRVGAEECLLAMPAPHPLARGDAVARSALAGHTVVMFPRAPTPAVWDAVAGALGLAGAAERVNVLPVNGQDAMVETALALGAVCPVSAGLAAGLTAGRPSAVVRRLEPRVHIALHLAWRHPAAAAVHVLAETARTAGAGGTYSPPPVASNGPRWRRSARADPRAASSASGLPPRPAGRPAG
jgi:hypothetical protein